MICQTCGNDPCTNPTFCAECKKADRRQPRRREPPRLRIVASDGVASAAELQRDYEAGLRGRFADQLPRATIDVAEYLDRLGDVDRFRAWLSKCTAHERRLLRAHFERKRMKEMA
jgi:hypothetical protein